MSDEYAAATSVTSGVVRYRIESPFLIVEHDKDGSSESVLLDEVESVRLTMVQGMGLCVLKTTSGKKVAIASRHVRGFADLVDRDEDYIDFIRSLHDEVVVVAPIAVLMSLGLARLGRAKPYDPVNLPPAYLPGNG